MAAAYRDVVSLPSASSVSGAGQTTWKLTGTAVPRFSCAVEVRRRLCATHRWFPSVVHR